MRLVAQPLGLADGERAFVDRTGCGWSERWCRRTLGIPSFGAEVLG